MAPSSPASPPKTLESGPAVPADRPASADRPAVNRSRRKARAAELQAQVELARRLAARGEDVELHGTVVNDGGGRVAATYGLLGTLATLIALGWPVRGALLLLVILLVAPADLDGGRSHLRRFTPRSIARTVLTWRAAGGGPGAGAPIEGPPPRPRVLLCIPADALCPRPMPAWGVAPLALGLLLGLAGSLLSWLSAETAGPMLLLAAGIFGLSALLGFLVDHLSPPGADPESGGRLLERLLLAFDEQPTEHTDLALAVVGGGTLFQDGIEILLRNHPNRLPPRHTHVLSWEPADGPLSAVRQEGRLFKRPAAPALVAAITDLGLPDRPGATAAGRAGRCGWRGLGLTGGLEDPAAVVRSLHAAVLKIDRLEGGRG